jgi:hypothetical protein
MASEYEDPASPQSQVVTVSGPNGVAFLNAYTVESLTKRNIQQPGGFVRNNFPLQSGSTTLGNTRPVYANDSKTEITPQAVTETAPPPNAPEAWAIETVLGYPRSRDPYRNNGMIGQPFFNNAG